MAWQIKQLVNHTQRALISGSSSNFKKILSGVPQISILEFYSFLNGEVKKCLSNLQNNKNGGIGNIPPKRNEMKNNNQVGLRNTGIL